MENNSLYENINVKGNGYISHCVKREQKVQTMIAIKITDTTEYYVRLEPATFAMLSERHTITPTDRMKS